MRYARRDNKMVVVVAAIGGAMVLVLAVALFFALSRDHGAVQTAGADSAPSVAGGGDSSDERANFGAESGAQTHAGAAGFDSDASWPDQNTTGGASRSSNGVGLLSQIDPVRDTLGGNWTREGSSLACSGGTRWALVVPQAAPAGYRWTVVAERISGHGALGLCLCVDGHQVMAMLEGHGNQVNGLSRLDGRLADRNETTRQAAVFAEGKPVTIVCAVGRSKVQVICDGKTVIDWTGRSSRLSLDRVSWPDLPVDKLAVTSYEGVRIRVDKMEIEPIDPGEAAPATSLADSSSPASQPSTPTPSPPPRPTFPTLPASPGSSSPSSPSPLPVSRSSVHLSGATIRLEDLPDAVIRSKQSVCIIEHPLGSGTGFVVAENMIATNAHVVDGAYVSEIECQFSSAGILKCRATRVLYEDVVRDLCLLEVVTDQAPIPVKSDHAFQRGEKVVIVGNPALGETDIVLRDAVTSGTITALVHTNKCDFYQIDATVNFGSSGGPAMNYDGEVVGVIAMKASARGESELRSALRRLDDSFTWSFTPFGQRGIAFGIPVNALSHAMQVVQEQSDSQVVHVGDRHMAKVLLGRLSMLGGLYLLQLQVNVPRSVRQQAANINTRNIPAATLNKLKFVPLIPEYIAGPLGRELDSDEVQKIMRVAAAGLEEKVKHLRESDDFDQMAAHNSESLFRSVVETKSNMDDPPATYQAYSQLVSKATDDLKSLVRRLKEQLDVEKAAYED